MIHGEVVLIKVIVLYMYALMQSFDFSNQSLCLSLALILASNGMASRFVVLIKENLIVTTAQYNIQYS